MLSFVLAACFMFMTSCARHEQIRFVVPPQQAPEVARSGYEVISTKSAVHEENVAKSNGMHETKRHRGIAHVTKGVFANIRGSAVNVSSPQSAMDYSYLERRTLREADAAFAREFDANVVYNTPKTMIRGKPTEIELLISRGKTVKELQSDLAFSGPQKDAQVKVTESVKAILKGYGFLVDPSDEIEQVVGSNNEAQWRWEVTPEVSGRSRTLELTIYDVITVNNKEKENYKTAYRAPIDVNIDVEFEVKEWIGDNWKWSCTAIIFPLVAWHGIKDLGKSLSPHRDVPPASE